MSTMTLNSFRICSGKSHGRLESTPASFRPDYNPMTHVVYSISVVWPRKKHPTLRGYRGGYQVLEEQR